MTQLLISEIVTISPTYTAEVDIAEDYCRPDVNAKKVEGYIPTGPAREAFVSIIQGLMPVSDKRVHLVTGQYGTGKSHFGLVLANLFGCAPGDPVLAPFFAKLNLRDPQAARDVQSRRAALPGRLLVVFVQPTTDPEGFNHSLLVALKSALDREGIPYDLPTRFGAAAALVERWSGDVELRPRVERELARQGTDSRRLLLNLRALDSEAYEIFRGVYKTIVHESFHAEHFGVPKDVYREAAQYLRREQQMAGILLVADEFGAYLSEMAREPTGRSANDIQDFVQFCKRSREDQVHVLIIAHRTVADYAAGHRSREEFAKLAGRFLGNEYPLTMSGGQAETIDMIDSVIIPWRENPNQERLWAQTERSLQPFHDWAQNIRLYAGQSAMWVRDRLVRGCYPLHPAATFCLPWLSQRVGQTNRTTFKFLDSTESGGLRAFIRDTPLVSDCGGLNLYTPDRLLEYFRAGIEERNEYKALLVARNDALAGSSRTPLAERLINTVAVLEIVQQPVLPRTRSVLAALVGCTSTEVEEAGAMLDLLAQQRVIRYREANNQYELRRRATGEIDVNEAIQLIRDVQARRGNVMVYEELRRREELQPLAARAYEGMYGLPRTAAVELVTTAHLANLQPYLARIEGWYQPGRRGYEGDALVLIVLAETQDEIDAARAYVAQGTGSPQVIVAVPRQPFGGGEALLDLAAITEIQTNGLKVQDSPVDPEDLERAKQDRATEADRQWQRFSAADNFIWYYGSNVNASVPSGGEDAFISNLLSTVFDKTPVVRDESLTALAGGRRERKADRQKAMARLLDTGTLITLQRSGGYPDDRMLRAALRDTELLDKKSDRGQIEEFELKEVAPAGSALAEIWAYLRGELTRRDPPISQLGPVVRKLLAPPFGLSIPLIELLLAAALRTIKDQVAVFDNAGPARRGGPRPQEITAGNLPKFVSNAEDHVSFFYEIRPEQREFIQQMLRLLGTSQGRSTTGGIWEQGKNVLLDWFSALSPAARQSTDVSTSALALVQWLSSGARLPDAKQMLSVDLPERLDVPILGTWSAATTRQLMANLKGLVTELEDVPARRSRAAQDKLCEIFEVTGATMADLDQGARAWFNSLSQLRREQGYRTDARPLLEAINQAGDPHKRYLEQLPRALIRTSYESWTSDLDIELFAERVQRYKIAVETWAPPVRDPAPQPRPNPTPNPPQVIREPGPTPVVAPKPISPTDASRSRIAAAREKMCRELQELNLTAEEKRQVLQQLLNEFSG